MRYYTVECECYRRGEWVAFVRETCYTVTATSREKLKAAVEDHLEQALGDHRFEVIWLG